jgi:hypothetical protein
LPAHTTGRRWLAPAKRDAPAIIAVVPMLMTTEPAAIMGVLRDFVAVYEP